MVPAEEISIWFKRQYGLPDPKQTFTVVVDVLQRAQMKLEAGRKARLKTLVAEYERDKAIIESEFDFERDMAQTNSKPWSESQLNSTKAKALFECEKVKLDAEFELKKKLLSRANT